MDRNISTPRLILRPWINSDLAPFVAMNQDPAVMEYFAALWTPRESAACMERFNAAWQTNHWGMFAAQLKSSGAFIGFIGLNIPAYPLPVENPVEIGWRLATPYWGQGLATEGAKASLAFGFDVLELPEIISFTPVTNTRSEAVMKKIGMTNTRRNFDHPKLPPAHPLKEHLLYVITRDSWRSNGAPDLTASHPDQP